MAQPILNYDATNMYRKAVGRHGADAAEIKHQAKRLKQAKQEILAEWKSGTQGWLGCPDDKASRDAVLAASNKAKRFKTCLVLGIGGSDLGARAAYAALGRDGNGCELAFAGANTDPDELRETMRGLDWKRTLVNVISKSGETVETISAFLVARDALVKAVGRGFGRNIVATTDPHKGALKELADQEGYSTLSLPANIGGRFSVMTPVGLFPLACSGMDVERLLKGARQVRETFIRQEPTQSGPGQFALLHYLGDTTRRQKIHVLMPYVSRLKDLAAWYRQLWAESLGKKEDTSGEHVFCGPTPVAALGATDQHSQLQLYTEGPNDKLITFIETDGFSQKVKLPKIGKGLEAFGYLSGKELGTINHAERRATAEALRLAHRPNGTIHIPAVTPESLGALFMFFEIATALAGKLYGINAYDQPGVETGKRAMFALLGRKGYAFDIPAPDDKTTFNS